jgi:predicted small lipoprotein YifL
LTRHFIRKKTLIALALSSAVLLGGCGRKGLPTPLDPEVAAKADAAKESQPRVDPTANSQKPLPKGRDDNSLKAGAPKGPSLFDFLL